LSSGATDSSIDFGFYQPVTVGNFVWNDVNGNGVQDAAEPGLAGVTVTLSGADGAGYTVSATTTTDATGAYHFTEPPGTYTVAASTPPASAPSAISNTTPATDSTVTPPDALPISLTSGATESSIDFGFYQPVTVGNFVWNDVNGNGVQDTAELGIAGVTVTL